MRESTIFGPIFGMAVYFPELSQILTNLGNVVSEVAALSMR
jgi:hypothetical protein